MPRKRKNSESSESQYNPEEDEDTSYSSSEELEDDAEESEEDPSSDESDDDDDVLEVKRPAAKKTRKNPPSVKLENRHPDTARAVTIKEMDQPELDEHGVPRRLGPAIFRRRTIVIDDEEEKLSSEQRKTTRGGYWMKGSQRAKIGAANKGNIPWNRGKHRSSADRARIAAGVRARNHTILLQKLERLGMTEDEWNKTKSKIKYIRESIRNGRQKNKGISEDRYLKSLHGYHKGGEHSDKHRHVTVVDNIIHVPAEGDNDKEDEAKDLDPHLPPEPKEDPRIRAIFPKQVEWKPLAFSDFNLLVSYEGTCPSGGPGGLICCEACSERYNNFLGSTMDNLETQRLKHETDEVKELSQYLEGTQNDLIHTIDKARKA
jgi:hypothetical protein